MWRTAENALIDTLCEEEDEQEKDTSQYLAHAGIFIAWLGKATFDFLLNSTGMIQFFQGIGYNANTEDPLFYVPNVIYSNFVQPCGKSLMLFVVNIVLAIVIQMLTDYQVDDYNTNTEG